jgi:hypothetical protein
MRENGVQLQQLKANSVSGSSKDDEVTETHGSLTEIVSEILLLTPSRFVITPNRGS